MAVKLSLPILIRMGNTMENEELPEFAPILTITANVDQPPAVDIGGMSILEAYTIIKAALDTLDLMIPHCNIASNGTPIITVQEDTIEPPE